MSQVVHVITSQTKDQRTRTNKTASEETTRRPWINPPQVRSLLGVAVALAQGMTETPKYHNKTSQRHLKSWETDVSNTSWNCKVQKETGISLYTEQSIYRENSISSSSSSSLGQRHWLERRSVSHQPESKRDPSQTSSYLLWHNFTDDCACCAGQGIGDIIMSENVFSLMTLNLHHV